MECEYDAVSKEAEIEEDLPLLIKVYPRRWVVLAVFFSLSVVNSFQWIQYVIITDQIPLALVDWTRMVFMACFIILILPACYALEKMGLRWCVEVGAILTAAGAWLKVVGVSSSSYWLAMLGQTIVGSGGVFVLGMPPKLASLWFGPDQISTACSIIVLGSKLGAALGLSLPPVLVKNHLKRADIEPDLKLLQQIIAGSSTLVLVLIILCSALHRMPGLPTDSTVGQLNQLFMTHDKRRVKRGGKKTEKHMAAGYFTTVNFLSSPHCFILSSPTIRMTSNPKQRPYNTLTWFQMNWDLADILRRRAYSIQTSPHPID